MAKIERTIPWGNGSDVACAPIYARLPAYNRGYRRWGETEDADNVANGEVSRWLTIATDELLCELKGNVTGFYENYLDPETARSDALDWLAQHLGFSGSFWRSEWPDEVKREILKLGDEVWIGRGSIDKIDTLLEAIGVVTCADVWPLNDTGHRSYRLPWLRADLGTADNYWRADNTHYFIRLPLTTKRGDETWQYAKWIVDGFTPVGAVGVPCFCNFYPDKSHADDPIFDEVWERSRPMVDTFWDGREPSDRPDLDFAALLEHLIAEFGITAQIVTREPFLADVTTADSRFVDVGWWGHPFPENASGAIGTRTNYDPAPNVFVVFPTSVTFRDDTWETVKRLIELYRPYEYFDPLAMIGHGVFLPELSHANAPMLWDDPADEQLWQDANDAVKAYWLANPFEAGDRQDLAFGYLLNAVLTALELPGQIAVYDPATFETGWAGHPDQANASGSVGTRSNYEPAPNVFVIFPEAIAVGDETWGSVKQVVYWFRPYDFYHPDYMLGYGIEYPDRLTPTMPVLTTDPTLSDVPII